MRWFISVLFLLASVTAVGASVEATYGENGMVSSRSTIASMAGLEILQAGGNAVDAAVATAFALAVTYPSAGNIGGGGFAVVRFADGRVTTLDHRETAPAAAHRDMYLDSAGDVIKDLSTASHLAAGVPGSVDGLLTLLEAHGSLPRELVMAPAIRLAQEGFVLSWYRARNINSQIDKMRRYPASVKKFTNNGAPFIAGDRWIQKDLAKTLRLISKKGKQGFYEGSVARMIVKEMQRGGGIITAADLKNYTSVWRDPVKGSYRGYDIWGMGPPSSGGVLVVQMLNMLESFNLSESGWGGAATIHAMIEAERRAYADRAEHLGDPDFYDVPTAQLIDKNYAKDRMSDFDLTKASDSENIGAGSWPDESLETTHFSVMDRTGMMVSLTTTLNGSYGNKIVVPGTGILLNNEMNDFSLKPNTANQYDLLGREANAIAPKKRMLSSMSPLIVTKEGKPVLITGSPGGATIITTTLQIVVNVIDHQMSIEDAVSAPRFHHQWKPNVVLYEPRAFSPDTVTLLRETGHLNLIPWPYDRGIGDANSILYKDGLMHGTKDPRNEGVAVGY